MKQTHQASTGILLLMSLCLCFCTGRKMQDRQQLFTCSPFPTAQGYGYVILQGSDTLIYQPFIPAIGGRRAFPTETQAKNTGQLIVQKLSEGKSPTLTREEVQNCLNKNSH